MRKETYEKLAGYSGYVETEQLLQGGFTNRQIAGFVEEGLLERVCHGYYRITNSASEKPKEYKAIEVCMSDSRAIICADSACFYQGLIQVEPEALSVATSRNDRSRIKMNFPVSRHYVSDNIFLENYSEVRTELGEYRIYDIDRSVCDCIRFREDIDTYIFELIIDTYRKREERQKARIMEYAKRLRMQKQVERILDE